MTILSGKDSFDNRVSEIQNTILRFKQDCATPVLMSAEIIAEAFINGNKLLICGNGGSAADSQHFAAEFVSSFSKNISRRAFSAIALTTDTSFITAFSNDFSFNGIFERQVQAHGQKNDVLVAITTSGESINCLRAVEQAKSQGMKSIAITSVGASITSLVNVSIEIPSNNTQHIQECHMITYHILAELVENSVMKKG
jgi:D-sedoheptulose 7-phosphate isomerase